MRLGVLRRHHVEHLRRQQRARRSTDLRATIRDVSGNTVADLVWTAHGDGRRHHRLPRSSSRRTAVVPGPCSSPRRRPDVHMGNLNTAVTPYGFPVTATMPQPPPSLRHGGRVLRGAQRADVTAITPAIVPTNVHQLTIAFTPPVSVRACASYRYSLTGASGPWLDLASVDATSPIVVASGLAARHGVRRLDPGHQGRLRPRRRRGAVGQRARQDLRPGGSATDHGDPSHERNLHLGFSGPSSTAPDPTGCNPQPPSPARVLPQLAAAGSPCLRRRRPASSVTAVCPTARVTPSGALPSTRTATGPRPWRSRLTPAHRAWQRPALGFVHRPTCGRFGPDHHPVHGRAVPGVAAHVVPVLDGCRRPGPPVTTAVTGTDAYQTGRRDDRGSRA